MKSICSVLRRSAAPLAFVVALSAVPALAQSAPAAGATADDDKSAEIVVTGSILRRTTSETPSPVTVLTADTLQKAGITTAADAIRSISADSAGSIGTGFQSGFSAGGSAISLRGLGVSSTLVLIDGLRSANFPINDDGHNAYVDLNSIPFSLIDSIEVLKDGASATYGADAIGGVVNLKLKKRFTGVAGAFEGGISQRHDAGRVRGSLTAGFGDYDSKGWNFFVNGEYQHDGRVSNHSRGFPYNTQDLSSIGGLDLNTADSSMTTATPSAVVARVSQSDLNNPLSGKAGSPVGNAYQLLNPSCPNGSFTQVATTNNPTNGTGCKYDLTDLYRQIQPLQERYSFSMRLSFRVSDSIEGYISDSYSHDLVSITSGFPSAIRNTQPFGASPTVASSNPGIVLPVYICSAGINCATAGDRRLNPNNPYAAAFAADPANGAARIYYLFGDIKPGSDRVNEVYRVATGLNGHFGDTWDWKVDGVYARDNLKITQHGLLNIAALSTAINTGSYNFVNPSANSQAVRNAIAPDKTTPSHSEMMSFDASISHKLMDLPGGPLQFAVGGQIRHETLENNNQNAALDTYNLTTSSAFGKHTVSAAFFEIDAPVHRVLDLTASGRYDHYSEGFSHFSPKFGFKFTPIPQLAFRGTYSQGFRAPTFAESGPLSQFAGFVTFAPPCNFVLAHGGTATSTGCTTTNPYGQSYSLGRGVTGNPNLKPETSRSFTFGTIIQPTRWFSLTADYYNVKKSNLIVTGPAIGDAQTAYFSAANLAAAQAAVAAVGPGYSVNTVDGVDPAFPNALPRVLIINVPFVNANYAITSGIDVAATVKFKPMDNVTFTSKIEVTHIFKYDLHTDKGVQHYAGTLGPYDLSSGNGTPDWRGNWQNTLQVGKFSLTSTASYVGQIKAVSEDQGTPLTCMKGNLYSKNSPQATQFCFIKRFINIDLSAQVQVNDQFKFWINVLNLFDAKAPIAPAAYASAPNFLTSWHYAGLIGRQFRAGASFDF
jgi:iron complex outermembrane receptor protein